MKTINRLGVVGMLLIATSLACSAQVVVNSPDHPKTYVSGAAKVHQALYWDPKTQTLVANVSYNTRLWSDGMHDPEQDDLTITFPGVSFDPQTQLLSYRGVTIGERRSLLFGYDIVLNRGVELSIHRHDGVIFGSIIALNS